MNGSGVAYHLRVNKYVDRKLFIEALTMVGRALPLSTYCYVSMGGGYLEDFRYVHQAFGIKKMLSFDMDEWVVKRQMFNRPYGFIRCVHRTSRDLVANISAERAELAGVDNGLIVWLDFTNCRIGSQLEDLELLVQGLAHGDIFRITLNADREICLGKTERFKKEREEGKHAFLSQAEWWNETLKTRLDKYFPRERDDPALIANDIDYVQTLCRAVRKAALNGLSSKPELTALPFLAVTYADGQRMLTISCVVHSIAEKAAFQDRVQWNSWPYDPGANWDNPIALAVPHLTLRERKQVHDLMYFGDWSDCGAMVDFQLDGKPTKHSEMIRQYREHYRRYPTFAPSDVI